MATVIIKLLFFTYLLSVSIRAYTQPGFWSLINNVNLIFHEAGHALTIFFGDFINIFGGTLFEFGVPLLITIYFLLKRQWYSAMFGAWWLSTAFYSISVYAGDAKHRQLPLLGGDSVGHDWFNLLAMTGTIRYYEEIAGFFMALSISSLALAVWLYYLDTKPTLKLLNRN